jgi:hypothetical protein
MPAKGSKNHQIEYHDCVYDVIFYEELMYFYFVIFECRRNSWRNYFNSNHGNTHTNESYAYHIGV